MSVWGTDNEPMTEMGAALEQIEAAIIHFYAAEPDHVWEKLKAKSPTGEDKTKWLARFNETRDRLKHVTPQLGDKRYIEEFDCIFMLTRACSKARYARTSKAIDEFSDWCRTHNYVA